MILEFVRECWLILVEAAPYVILGFLAAGLLKALLPEEKVARHLGRESAGSVLKASLVGIPLPLCSCGVIPAAIGLRRQGASRGASAAFLVSTPESGVDSIAITWALTDPLMTVIRPVAAFLTATATGLLINRLPAEPEGESEPVEEEATCGCSGACAGDGLSPSMPILRRLREGIVYAFDDLLREIGGWLLLGIALAGLIALLLPEGFFGSHLTSEPLSLLVMLLVGVPMYICASASTPVAAAMVLKGLSPGAALVFLLAGPATNAATITVVGRFWGRGATLLYLGSIAVCSLLLGWVTNRLYAWSGLDPLAWTLGGPAAESPWSVASALLLLALLALAFLRPLLSRRSGRD